MPLGPHCATGALRRKAGDIMDACGRFHHKAGKLAGLLAIASLSLLVCRAPALAYSPLVTLPQGGLSGQPAIDALGSNLEAVASAQGRTGNELRTLLLRDPTLKVDRFGWLYYAEDLAQVPATPPSSGSRGADFRPLSETFNLHSLSVSAPDLGEVPVLTSSKIYLNFKGATISGTGWNATTGMDRIELPPFDLDGNPENLSDAELRTIQAIWQRVAADFAPFGVDVTTDATPEVSELSVKLHAVVITSSAAFSPCQCPSVSYASNFMDESFGPDLVFHDRLFGNDKLIGEAISHQLGHRLGLDHDGTATLVQYPGHRDWAPIMGRNYLAAVTQFSKGEYQGANNLQDDVAIIGRQLGLRRDYIGGTLEDARRLTYNGSPSPALGQGVINGPDDADYFVFSAERGVTNITVKSPLAGSNANLAFTLLDDDGRVLRSGRTMANPSAGSLPISFTLTRAGTYYLRVQGSGFGDRPSTGYSAYGSLGFYNVSVTAPPTSHRGPSASIRATQTFGIAPLTATLSVEDRNTGDIRYFWNLGNGTVNNSGTSTRVTSVYSSPGIYRATLKVVDSQGFSQRLSQTIISGNSLQGVTVTLRHVKAEWIVITVEGGRVYQALRHTFSFSIPSQLYASDGQGLPNDNVKVWFTDPSLGGSAYGPLTSTGYGGLSGTLFSISNPCIEARLYSIEINGKHYLPPRPTTGRSCL